MTRIFEEFCHFTAHENGAIFRVLGARLVRYDRLAEFLQRGFGPGMTWQVDLAASTGIMVFVIRIEFS